ncbi:MAG TPA: bifunctional acetaldehyde-CoA/alcohol dehydrogenase [Planctomycetes bacterium]|nr:bifunctional acetaldehyde-CoA/alcohol dehydrogenase [Planctomycetota bacterium]
MPPVANPAVAPSTAPATDLDTLIASVRSAQERFSTFSQEQVDEIFVRTASAINRARIELAKAAVAETGMGVVEDKVIKNHFASETICNAWRETQTVGEVDHDPVGGVRTVLAPVGTVAAIIPVTNPTSTAAFKILLALKTRCGIVLAPHPRAKGCTALAARIASAAATAAGAPEGIIACIAEPALETTQALMQHKGIDLILATGGPGMVRAAYASGKPAIGVGAGNTPALIDETADVAMAATSIVTSKTFDNGVICASEQSLVVVDGAYDAMLAELRRHGCHLLDTQQRAAVEAVMTVRDLKKGNCAPRLNAAIVGQCAETIAKLAGITVPAGTRVLLATAERIGDDEAFSMEKLSPILAVYRAADFRTGVRMAARLVEHGGLGHTAVLYTAPGNQDRITAYGHAIRTARILVNQPSSHGAIGDLYNFRLAPSLTLGCGSWGGNSFAGNVGVHQLLNRKTITERRENLQWYRVPPRIYHGWGSLGPALADLRGRSRAVIVTDRTMVDLGVAGRVADQLRAQGLSVETFADVRPDPDLDAVEMGLRVLRAAKPDVILALGGGSPIDAAKIMWLLYEQPETDFDALSMRFLDIRKRIHQTEALGRHAWFVAVPTTSGTGSEVTPFAVITARDGVKYPIADYALTPTVAVVDAELAARQPKGLTAAGGMDAVSHAMEAIASVCATDFTTGQAIDALRLLFAHLPAAWREGEKNRYAREQVHMAASLAGMAFANAFLGICHSLAHKLGARFHLPHGVANAILLPHVIRFNAAEAGHRISAFPRYDRPQALDRYARAADALGLGGATVADKAELLAQAVERLRDRLEMPGSIKEAGVDETAFRAALDELAERAFDDQCTGANPRAPLIADLKAIYLQAWG